MITPRLLGFLMTGAALGVATVGAQNPSATSGSLTLAGVVRVDDGSHTPLGGAVVTLSGAELPRSKAAITDVNGRFAFERLPAGRFTLNATKAPYLTMAYGAKAPGRLGTPVTLPRTENNDIVITLPPGGVITGTVRDSAGRVLPDVHVSIFRTPSWQSPVNSMTTDDRGMYRFFGLTPGSYIVGGLIESVGVSSIDVPTTAEIDRRFAEWDRAGGGAPASTVPKSASAVRPAVYGQAATFYPGTVDAREAAPIALAAGDERVADFVVSPVSVVQIEGRIGTGDGSPLPVIAFALETDGPSALDTYNTTVRVRPTPANGRFLITGVPPGHYNLKVVAQAGRSATAAPTWASAELSVSDRDVTGLNLILHSAVHVSGRVVVDAGTAAATSLPSAMRVTLNSGDGQTRRLLTYGMPRLSVNAAVGADDKFDLTGLVPGNWTFSLNGAGSLWLRSAIADGRDAADVPLQITDSDIRGMTVTLASAGAQLSGALQTWDKEPATDFTIVVLTTDRGLWRSAARRIRSTRPATDGQFHIDNLPSGEYFIAALTDAEPDDLADPAFLESLAPSAIKLTLGEGERRIQNLTVKAR